MRIKQIGVMGSAADLNYEGKISDLANKAGKEIAKSGYTLIYGAEKDYDSLSTSAARGAKSEGGKVVAITYGKTPDIWGNMADKVDAVICTGMERGGGREYILVSSCDAIIVIGGGSGSLNEITIAYQKKIPIVVIKDTGGRADRLVDQYIDERYKNDLSRFICKGVDSVEEAIEYIRNI